MNKGIRLWMLGALLGAASLTMGCSILQGKEDVVEVVPSEKDTHWHINITGMNTMRYGSHMVSLDFFLEMRGDTLWSNLPYLGQAFRSDMGETDGIMTFELPVRNLKMTRPKEGMKRLQMEIKKRTETLRYSVDIWDNGNASISVRSDNRDAVWYDGDVREE